MKSTEKLREKINEIQKYYNAMLQLSAEKDIDLLTSIQEKLAPLQQELEEELGSTKKHARELGQLKPHHSEKAVVANDELSLLFEKAILKIEKVLKKPAIWRTALVLALLAVVYRVGRRTYDNIVYKGHGLSAEYFSDTDLKNLHATRMDPTINFSWQYSPAMKGLPADFFSTRWSGSLNAPQTGAYVISTLSDDGIRVWIDDKLIIQDWAIHANAQNSAQIDLTKGPHKLKVEYFEGTGDSAMKLFWKMPGQFSKQIIGRQFFTPLDPQVP